MQHQAEAEKQIQDEEKRLYKERQKRYKEDLDKQYLEVGKQQTAKRRERGGGATIPGLDNEQRDRENQERKKATTEELLREMQEREQARKSDRDRDLAEKLQYERYLKTVEESELQRSVQDKQRKDRIAASLRFSYGEQQQQRKSRKDAEKEQDRRLIEVEQSNWPVVDSEKKKVYLVFILIAPRPSRTHQQS